MTRFHRKGHWRTSVTGYRHWVDRSSVDRTNWARNATDSYALLQGRGAIQSYAGRIILPNARCPVCGELVFFYQNEYGSKVYFDDLGIPWPKHPCTDNSPIKSSLKNKDIWRPTPEIRDQYEIAAIQDLLDELHLNPEEIFQSRFGKRPCNILTIKKIIKTNPGALLAAEGFQGAHPYNLILHCTSKPRSLKNGTIFSYRSGALSFFDISSMLPNTLKVDRISSLPSFISKLLHPESD